MNLNELAKKISDIEGGKHNLNIAEIKEVLAKLGLILAYMDLETATSVLTRLIKSGKK